ncbi:MAG: response regulator transcription factor [Deltaproteobacteria bacterium]|nr:response regulator transcription factor [Deltaproteobacteria bacterium]
MNEKVLVVDDDARLRALLKEYLEGYGFQILTLADGCSVMETIRDESPEMVILDIMLPRRDGLEVLKDIRTEYGVPVIMLTAKGEDADRIVGLELGADDYLPKPFNPRELLARMRAVLRRLHPEPLDRPETSDECIEAGGLTLNLSRRTLLVQGREIELSATEYKILEAMMGRPNTVFTRDQLMNIARGRDAMAFDRSVDVHISNLRGKMKPFTGDRELIKTVWGSGYKFVEAP